eukprot:TRINITY_DN20370_c0_g1_i2.p1 TRINITY_DN20370_c0_g1~~TRINITY_DN20370_c0_g1_i2.p1  ORF type:complete len:375 (-),score=63.50 TRINITY_DN20370_c0_g1_i2:65-1189(-)
MLPANAPATSSTSSVALDHLHFPRDIGVCSAYPWDLATVGLSIPWAQASSSDPHGCACVQVDDLGSAWGIYALGEGTGQNGSLAATKLINLLPGLLARNPSVFSAPCAALYESCVLAQSLATIGAGGDSDCNALGAVFLRDGFLHLAWDGKSKIVLGRLAAHQAQQPPPGRKGVGTKANVENLRPASRRKAAAKPENEVYIGSGQMRQWIKFEGPPPILRAVDLTAAQAGEEAEEAGPTTTCGLRPTAHEPEVRRMRLKPGDVCVVIGSESLWRWLTPDEVVTIIGQNMHRMATLAANALLAEVRKRMSDPASQKPEDYVTVVVVYLTGESYVQDWSMDRAQHMQGALYVSESLTESPDFGDLAGCCRPMACSK